MHRIALYSHGTVGLGHSRRQLAIASAIAHADPDADLLLLTGNPEAASLRVPPRTEIVTLPTVTKDEAGSYRPRIHSGTLARALDMRSAILTAALTSFDPHLLIVDKAADGLGGELLPVLDLLHGRTRIVLGLREVLDEAPVVRREWLRGGTARLIREVYDEIWVYGDPTVYEPAAAYGWDPEVRARTAYLGYLGKALPQRGCGRPYILCQAGGGADGLEIAAAFLRSTLPDGVTGKILTGPYMPARDREHLDALRRARDSGRATSGRGCPQGGDITIHRFVDNSEELLAGAAAVISMAGYNSTVEMLSSRVPALLVPRVFPRKEQLIRAQYLAVQGSVDILTPDRLRPAALTAWIRRALTPGDDAAHATARARLDLGGLDRVTTRTSHLIGALDHAA